MTHLEIVEETLLLGLLAAFALLYVWQRARLAFNRRRARRILRELFELEEALRAAPFAPGGGAEATAARLRGLEERLTIASRRLIDWRSSEVERWIVGRQIEPLLIDYERAGAMTTRLQAMLAAPASR